MTWGVFDGVAPWRHVAPCTEDGDLAKPHILSTACSCNPAVYDDEPLIVHEVIQ